jgi:hypothetical protein
MAFEFLEQVYTSIQHYGVEIDSLRYNGEALNPYRNSRSPLRGPHAGKWPIAVDPADVTRVYFQDPRQHEWHPLVWEHAAAMNGPVSREAAGYARRLAAKTHRFPDTKRALVELLERWGAGLTADRAERRMAVRMSQERLRLVGEANPAEGTGEAAALPTLARISAVHADDRTTRTPAAVEDSRPPGLHLLQETGEDAGGDDDEDTECDADLPGDGLGDALAPTGVSSTRTPSTPRRGRAVERGAGARRRGRGHLRRRRPAVLADPAEGLAGVRQRS